MFERVRHLVLRFLRVPPEPEPPFGAPASIRVFRASRKLYWLRLIGWGIAQMAALLGILFWVSVLMAAEHEAKSAQAEAAAKGQRAPVLKPGRHRPPAQAFKDVAVRVPQFVFVLLWIAKGLGVVIYLGQLAVTYAAVRLDYEMRWYLVTDRSLRIRSGLWKVREMTMSFANLQQVMVSQGPLQRLLGIADVRVQSAGGGGGSSAAHHGQHSQGDNMHTGVFHGVENAFEVRDLILDRLRHFRETGLGDPDEVGHRPAADSGPETVAAARELLAETRQLRCVIESGLRDQLQQSS
jgi:Bacterial PH domain